MSAPIQIGDRFKVEVEVLALTPNNDACADVVCVATQNHRVLGSDNVRIFVHTLEASERLPRAWKVGDTVQFVEELEATEGRVAAIEGRKAWVNFGGDYFETHDVARLRPAPEPGK